jgi:hypothetical protein
MFHGVIRRQASLYLPEVPHIESLRTRFNPVQAQLIPAHVTLIREDEVIDWCDLRPRIDAILPLQLQLGFGAPRREDHLVYLPVVAGQDQFDELRRRLLNHSLSPPRKQSAHVTIIHPRNGVCTDAAYQEIVSLLKPFTLEFCDIALIEQVDGGPWMRFEE